MILPSFSLLQVCLTYPATSREFLNVLSLFVFLLREDNPVAGSIIRRLCFLRPGDSFIFFPLGHQAHCFVYSQHFCLWFPMGINFKEQKRWSVLSDKFVLTFFVCLFAICFVEVSSDNHTGHTWLISSVCQKGERHGLSFSVLSS